MTSQKEMQFCNIDNKIKGCRTANVMYEHYTTQKKVSVYRRHYQPDLCSKCLIWSFYGKPHIDLHYLEADLNCVQCCCLISFILASLKAVQRLRVHPLKTKFNMTNVLLVSFLFLQNWPETERSVSNRSNT